MMSEALEVRMQLVQLEDGSVLMDIEPPVDKTRERLIRDDLILREIPEVSLRFKGRTPDVGDPFTEINCAAARAGVEEKGLEFDDEKFAARIEDIFTAHGDKVTLKPGILPIAQRGYRFLGLTPESPPDEDPAETPDAS